MVQLNGEPVAIDKSTISSRRNIHQSPMPPYDGVLNPRDVADLVTWLMKQRAAASGGFTWTLQRDRLSILHAGRHFADYVFAIPRCCGPISRTFMHPVACR